MHAAAEDLPELPGIEADVLRVGAVDRRLDDHRGVRWPERVGPPSTRPRRYSASPAMSNAAVLHADIDVIGPGARIVLALRVGQHVAAMRADVVDRLILRQQFDRAVDAVGHKGSLRSSVAASVRPGPRAASSSPAGPSGERRKARAPPWNPPGGFAPWTPSPRVKRPVAGAGAAFAIHPFRLVGREGGSRW